MHRWAQIWQCVANYPAQLPTKPTSHRHVWEPLPSQRPMGISPHSPAALGAAFITQARENQVHHQQEESETIIQVPNNLMGISSHPGRCAGPSSSDPPAHPTLPLPYTSTLQKVVHI